MNTIPIYPARQNVDINAKPSDFPADMLAVTSHFYTLQGEGPFAGHPAVFLRLAGCNYGAKLEQGACAWCDTSFQLSAAQLYSTSMLAVELVTKYAKAFTPANDLPPAKGDKALLVITGGEPLLQSPELLAMFLRLLRHELPYPEMLQVQFETNGTQMANAEALLDLLDAVPHFNMDSVKFVVSPKAIYKANAYPGNPLKTGSAHLIANSCLKFVVEANPNSPHLHLPDWAYDAKVPVYISPMAVYKRPYVGEVSSIWDQSLIDADRTAANYAYAAQLVMDNPRFKLSLQTHLFTAIP